MTAARSELHLAIGLLSARAIYGVLTLFPAPYEWMNEVYPTMAQPQCLAVTAPDSL